MILTFAGGTDRQTQLVFDALNACSFPLDGVVANVAITWGSPPSSDTSHPYMVTTQTGDTDFAITIEPWADDPTYPENQGLPDPPANIDQFYRESFIHELGHVISFMTFARTQATIEQMCELFWTAQIGAAGGKRQGNRDDFNPAVDWGLRIMEAVAEVFKSTFCPTPRVFENRTLWHLDAANFSAYLQLITREDNVHDVRWGTSGDLDPGSGGDFDFSSFPGPLVLDGSPISVTAVLTPDFLFQGVFAVSPTEPTRISADWQAEASWYDTLGRGHDRPIDNASQLHDVTSITPVDVHFSPPAASLSFNPPPGIPPHIEFLMFAETLSPNTNQASLSYTLDFIVLVTGTGKYIQLQYRIGFDEILDRRYEHLNFISNTQQNGNTFSIDLGGAGEDHVTTPFSWSDHGALVVEVPWEGFIPQGNYPFANPVGSIDVSRMLRGALPPRNGIHGRAPAVGPTRFIGDANPPHIVLQATDTQKQSQSRRGATGRNGLRGALIP